MMNVTLPIAAEADETKAPVLAEGEQDWQLLCTDGHVRGHRVVAVLKVFTIPALISGLIGAFIAYQSVTMRAFPLPFGGELSRALAYDPATFVRAPAVSDSGLDYRLAWLADLTPARGLDERGWADLLKATVADLTAHGDKTADYAAIPALAAAPVVTRPGKVFSDHSADLASGVIAIPQQVQGQAPRPVHVVAWVSGKLAWAGIVQGRIGIIFGPVPEGTGTVPPYAAPDLVNQLKPGA